MNIKRYLIMLLASVMALGAAAQEVVMPATLVRNNNYMDAQIEMDLAAMKPHGNKAVVLTPVLEGNGHSLTLPSVGIYNHRRYIHYLRENKWITGPDEKVFKSSEVPASPYLYQQIVPYEDWMNNCTLSIKQGTYGCCSSTEETLPLVAYEEEVVIDYVPDMAFVTPVSHGPKEREVEGQAYIDFPVNRIEIFPDYRNNPAELAKIRATIDTLREDKDVTLKSMTIKGYASPEGSYANNVRLAKGRTQTLKEYVQKLYAFPANFIQTSYEPEDWAGLKKFVEGCNLPNKDAILALINSDMEPDAKNTAIQKRYPSDYQFLLKNVYPGLRHSDYKVEYVVRSYTDIEEIKRVMKTRPQNLDLGELYSLAMTYEPGSQDYNDVFALAVRLFPDDEVANLNAANAEMQVGDYTNAARHLQKAGDGAEAVYARGVLDFLQQNYEGARSNFQRAAKLKMPKAVEALEMMDQLKL